MAAADLSDAAAEYNCPLVSKLYINGEPKLVLHFCKDLKKFFKSHPFLFLSLFG